MIVKSLGDLLNIISTMKFRPLPFFARPQWLALLTLFIAAPATAQFTLPGERIKQHADDVLALMAFSVVPDLTSSFLSIGSGTGETKSLSMTQVAGGDIISKDFPIYLEGGAAYIRYDPEFVATNGQQTMTIPFKWNSVSVTGGIGWDFYVLPNLKIRPIFNFALGQVASDLSLFARYIEFKTDRNLDFLNGGQLNAYGLGGSLMIDYEYVSPEYELDVEWRYTNIHLKSFGSTSEAVQGSADAEATSLYTRYRAPTGWTLMDRPLRYVLEGAHTTYLGDQKGLLGFNHMNSIGLGFEFDSSAYDVIVSRTRIVARYAFGQNVRGFAVGLAMSF
jgi:hypothetical protein